MRPPLELDGSLVRLILDKTHDRLENRGLTRPVVPEDRGDGALLDGE